MKPLLKWAGGKRHIADTLQGHLPEGWNSGTYYEPFLGGAAFFMHLAPTSAQLSDVNTKLIGFYNTVKNSPNELVTNIEEIAAAFNQATDKKQYFLDLRVQFNEIEEPLKKSALMYALNKLCFNGLYRENRSGKFNVPFGQKSIFPAIDSDDFIQLSAGLETTELLVSDFEAAVAEAKSGDFVYFDPPYVPLEATPSFTTYSSDGFGNDAQLRLAALMRELGSRGVKAMLSNSYTDATKEFYSGLRMVEIEAPRMVSAKSSGRGKISELLIMNY